MYELKVTNHFAAAHNLRDFHGKCENLHGHNWFVEARVRADGLDSTGLVMDFAVLKRLLNGVLDLIDHKYLNELEYFKVTNPTSENIARFIFDRLAPDVREATAGKARLRSVSAWESDNAAATYIGPGEA
ncbi:MAG: 6-carboxytetrahydropterin synthase QueD [Deltaproteobacteria bacterium]|jgi:6-pyruvoyltetrahydropterin/6-carboxytetrahydropterin synthase|nr:6-carboxytetrahydropterin synthase QueD [Deltaproteobacteria bacterium]